MQENYFKGKFVNDKGKVVNKEKTSRSISATELGREVRNEMKEKGYRYESGSYGTRSV